LTLNKALEPIQQLRTDLISTVGRVALISAMPPMVQHPDGRLEPIEIPAPPLTELVQLLATLDDVEARVRASYA
jgi:hypothetical protein